MKKLIYIDPGCSGVQIVDMSEDDSVLETLAKNGVDEDNCCDHIYAYIIEGDFVITEADEDFI